MVSCAYGWPRLTANDVWWGASTYSVFHVAILPFCLHIIYIFNNIVSALRSDIVFLIRHALISVVLQFQLSRKHALMQGILTVQHISGCTLQSKVPQLHAFKTDASCSQIIDRLRKVCRLVVVPANFEGCLGSC